VNLHGYKTLSVYNDEVRNKTQLGVRCLTTKEPPKVLRGFRDFLPKEARERKWLKEKIVEVFELWGYEPLETPTLEYLALFEGQIGEDEKLFYSFEDHGGRKVALRYDQTVPTCRVVGEYWNQITNPFRRYQLQMAYRAERPQKGRYREFLQCDADIFGSTSPLADAEVIALGLDIYRRLGFPLAKVLVNDRSLLKDIPYAAIAAVDKLAKIGRDGVIADMEGKGISKGKAEEYLSFIEKLQPNDTVNTIFDYLKNAGFSKDWYAFEPTLARSFSYSTGPIWEIIIPNISSGSVLGGERYDKLIEQVSGKTIPGTGFGMGFDRTLEAARTCGLLPAFSSTADVLVTVFEKKHFTTSLAVAMELRTAGIATELYPEDSVKIAKQLQYASKREISYAIIIGEDEITNNTLVLKNLTSGEQIIIPRTSLVSQLQEKLSL